MTERSWAPLAVLQTAANVNEGTVLVRLVDAIPALWQPRGHPGGPRRRPAKLHADKGYDYPAPRRALRCHIAPRTARPRIDSSERLGRHRWGAERTLAWLHRNRHPLVRYKRRADLHQAFLDLGAALICWQLLAHDQHDLC